MNSKSILSIFLSIIVFTSGAASIDVPVYQAPLLVINVLTSKYYDDCHISGSINVPISMLSTWARAVPKDTHIIVYCAHSECSNGPAAWAILKNMGFTHVSDYAGGSAAWYQAGLPVQGLEDESLQMIKVIQQTKAIR